MNAARTLPGPRPHRRGRGGSSDHPWSPLPIRAVPVERVFLRHIAPPAMSACDPVADDWIVKGRPAENDFDAWLRPKRLHPWRTAAPPANWEPGDRLFFWKAAPELCVVGLGELFRVNHREPRGTETLFLVRYLSPSLSRP